MFFKDIPGQQEIKERLVRSVIANRVSHAQLFLGAEGSMKLPMALAYARFIMCQARVLPESENIHSIGDACGTCPACRKFNSLAHPDLHFIFPVASTPSIKKPVSDLFLTNWRNLYEEKNGVFSLNDWYHAIETENKQPIINTDDCNQIIRKLSYKSYESDYKVMIIWMIEKLYHSAAPKILKILEEPPDKTVFLLIAQDQSLILNTILSRTQMIRFPRLKQNDISAWLEKRGVSHDQALRAALLADGNVLHALDIIENAETTQSFFENFRQWFRYCFKPQTSMNELTALCENLATTGRESQKRFLSYGLELLRQTFLARLDRTIPGYTAEEALFIKNLIPFVHYNNVTQYEKLFTDAIYHIERNANPKILFLDMSLKLVKLIKLPA